MDLKEIHKSLFDWCEEDGISDKDRNARYHFWYSLSFMDLAKVLLHEEGYKIILNIDNFKGIEKKLKKLYLISDIIALRDNRGMGPSIAHMMSVPVDFFGFNRDKLKDFKPPSILIPPFPPGITGQFQRLSAGFRTEKGENKIAVAGSPFIFQEDTYDWMFKFGRKYFETGKMIFAPFIPPIEMEVEFLRQGVSLPFSFDAQSVFSGKLDWVNEKELTTLLMLNLPTLENVDIELLEKIKYDNYDNFKLFRNSLLTAIKKIKDSIGTESFINEVRHIQRNDIDDSIAKLNFKVNKISNMRVLRNVGCVIGVAGLSLGTILGLPETAIVAGASVNLVNNVANLILRMKENEELNESPYYFLWKLELNSK